MKRKTLFKRLSSVAMALLLSLSALTQGVSALQDQGNEENDAE